MRKAEQVMAFALLVIAAALMREATRLQISWTAIGPGAGFFPFWLSVGVGISAAIILVQSIKPAARNANTDEPLIPPHAWKPLMVVLLPMAAVIAFLDILGIYLGGAIYLAGYTRLVGRFRWPVVILVSLAIPLMLFLIFERWFLLPLPKGVILERILYGGP